MELVCCGISHRTASVVDRSRFQLARSDLPAALASFRSLSSALEVAVLATCNRVEFYAVIPGKTDPIEVVRRLFTQRGAWNTSDGSLWFVRHGSSVARHLFRVTAGLDSPALGETQVFGQVKEAYALACSAGGPGAVLHKLFHLAFQAAKRIHSETSLGARTTGMAGCAFELAQRRLGENLAGAKAVVIGVNSSAEILVNRLFRAAAAVTVVNRTRRRAEALARTAGAAVLGLDDLSQALSAADLLFSVTAAPGCIVYPEHLAVRSNRPLIAFDLAVPRDISPEVAHLPGVVLYDLDDIKRHLEQTALEASADLPYAEDLIREQVDAFERWRRSRAGGNHHQLRKVLDDDRRLLLAQFESAFKSGEHKALEAFSRSLYAQFIRRLEELERPSETLPTAASESSPNSSPSA